MSYYDEKREKYKHRGVNLRFDRQAKGVPYEYPNFNIGSARLIDVTTHMRALNPDPGVFEFDQLDKNIAMLKGRLELMYCLFRTPEWNSVEPNKNGTSPPKDYAAVGELIKQIHSRYGITLFEMTNEPWTSRHWTGSVDDLVDFTLYVCDFVHTNIPGGRVISAADNYDTDNKRDERHLYYISRVIEQVDIVGMHLYGNINPTRMATAIQFFKSTAKYTPVWCTEVGFETSDTVESAYEVYAVLSMCEQMGIERTYLFDWCSGGKRELNYPMIKGALGQMP